jgi:hypothetical protein
VKIRKNILHGRCAKSWQIKNYLCVGISQQRKHLNETNNCASSLTTEGGEKVLFMNIRKVSSHIIIIAVKLHFLA